MNKNFVLSALGIVLSLVALAEVFVLLTRPVEIPPLGSTPGTDVSSNYFSIGGVQYYESQVAMVATSSEPCQFPNGFAPATSTIQSLTINISSTSPTGIGIATLTYDVSTSSAFTGSSTPALVYGRSVTSVSGAAHGGNQLIWSPMSTSSPGLTTNVLAINAGLSADGSSPFFVRGSDRITMRIATGTPGTFSTYANGTCSIVERKL